MRTGRSFESSANCPNEKIPEAPVLCLRILQPRKGSLIIHDIPSCNSSLSNGDGPFRLHCRDEFPLGLVKIKREALRSFRQITLCMTELQ